MIWQHDFVPAEPETAGKPDEPCINSGGCRYLVGSHCAHGCREAADAVTRLGQEMEPEAHEHDWTVWGAVYHGGHSVWRKCFDCAATESRSEGHICPEHPEPEAPECSACGGNDPEGCPFCKRKAEYEHRLAEMCFGTTDEDEPEAPEGDPFDGAPDECLCGHDRAEHRAGLKAPYEGCNWCKCSQFIKDAWDHEVAPVRRRPPYAVAYEIGDGRLYEVALSGDAVATVEDGVFKISHATGVAHIVQVKPIKES